MIKIRVGFLMLNPGKDFLDWSRVIECLEQYGHECEMLGYNMADRDFDSYIKKHKIDMLVMGEDQSAFSRQFCGHGKLIKFPTAAVVGEGMVCDLSVEGEHNYFANGLLVHNSRYAHMAWNNPRQKGFW